MKQYIITDPSYLLTNADWNEFADLLDAYGYGEEADKFLTENLFTPVKCEDTGHGDWVNRILPVTELACNRILQEGFCADTGTVCFLELTDYIRAVISSKKLDKHCYAVIECENPVCKFDTSNLDWTVIKINDGKTMFRSVMY